MRRTLYDKLFDSHVVAPSRTGRRCLYIDRHLVHDGDEPAGVRGPQARRPQAVARRLDRRDRGPTTRRPRNWAKGIQDPISRTQVETLDANIRAVRARRRTSRSSTGAKGIVHVIGPENPVATLPA
jgi:3-isopropylmalate/(R)-2-methylmalate dehydratase large subunit